jgi:DNA mismatch repair protein MutS2
MNEKDLQTLEFPAILEILASYAGFSASANLALELRPTADLELARQRQALTSEARLLLSIRELKVGGVQDIRPKTDLAAHGGVLSGSDLLDIKNTLVGARSLKRRLTNRAIDEPEYPHLSTLAETLELPAGLIDAISKAISDQGEILDQASEKLAKIRSDLKKAHARLLQRLERYLNDPKTAPMLQEPIITQRSGRYVIPLMADFKGKFKSVVHDQSASGATLFVEPLPVVELNNQRQELQLAERDEERRILAELSKLVGDQANLISDLIDVIAKIDLALMCARYAEDISAAEPVLTPFKTRSDGCPGGVIHLLQARHPLLSPRSAVPIDVLPDEKTFAVVITGPNTGGKTVTLKTVGLLTLMSQSGLHIPALSGSQLSPFSEVLVDIGDEQSIEQSLSTFSGHIKNIIRILEQASPHSLVLLDELGAGTDPQEGAALARGLMQYLVAQQLTCLVATHYPELKTYAHATDGISNASMQFDLETLQPTYHLTIGLPGRSNALLIAEKLGLPAGIIQAARETVSPLELKADDLLDDIHHQRELARRERQLTEEHRQRAEEVRAELSARLENIEDERLDILENSRRQSQEEIAQLNTELEDTRRHLKKMRLPVEELKAVEDKLEELRAETQDQGERRHDAQAAPAPRPLKIGDRVRLHSLKMEGLVSAIHESDVEVQLGALRVRANPDDIARPQKRKVPGASSRSTRIRESKREDDKTEKSVFHPSPGVELNLRGQTADEALPNLEHHLELAYLAGLPFVHIIHGKGTGRLRQAVRQALRSSAHVTSWVAGSDAEGGEGVTIARLSSE